MHNLANPLSVFLSTTGDGMMQNPHLVRVIISGKSEKKISPGDVGCVFASAKSGVAELNNVP